MLNSGERAQVPVEVYVPSTGVIGLDVVFLVDQTGSFDDDVETLQEEAQAIIEDINSRGIDVNYGVAGFGDYSVDAVSQTVFTVHQDITDSVKATIAALDDLASPLLQGGDAPEAQYEALYRATKEFSWRTGALRVILLATDAPFHDSGHGDRLPGHWPRNRLGTSPAGGRGCHWAAKRRQRDCPESASGTGVGNGRERSGPGHVEQRNCRRHRRWAGRGLGVGGRPTGGDRGQPMGVGRHAVCPPWRFWRRDGDLHGASGGSIGQLHRPDLTGHIRLGMGGRLWTRRSGENPGGCPERTVLASVGVTVGDPVATARAGVAGRGHCMLFHRTKASS